MKNKPSKLKSDLNYVLWRQNLSEVSRHKERAVAPSRMLPKCGVERRPRAGLDQQIHAC